MKTLIYLWLYLTEFFVDLDIFQTNFFRKSKHDFFLFEIGAVYEIMLKNIVQPERTQMTIWRMCVTCRIPKAKWTHSEYVILTAFPLLICYTKAPQCYVIRALPVFLLAAYNTNNVAINAIYKHCLFALCFNYLVSHKNIHNAHIQYNRYPKFF